MVSVSKDAGTAQILCCASATVRSVREVFARPNLSRARSIRLLAQHVKDVETLRRTFEALHYEQSASIDGEILCDVTNALSLVYYRIGRIPSADNLLTHTWNWVVPSERSAPGLSQIAVNRCRLARISKSPGILELILSGSAFIKDWRRALDMLAKQDDKKLEGLSIYQVQFIALIREGLLAISMGSLPVKNLVDIARISTSWDGPPVDIIWLGQAASLPVKVLSHNLRLPHISMDDGTIYRFIFEQIIEAYLP